ncbi:MAG: hypothetical protein HY877_06350 [Deltaproteobacteria bacterium]|nr:hypothetical protein [Deltaproteobacteria bacterium]
MSVAIAVTPNVYIPTLLDTLANVSLAGDPLAIAEVLTDLSGPVASLGGESLSASLAKFSRALRDGSYVPSQWHRSDFYTQFLATMRQAVLDGRLIEESTSHAQRFATQLFFRPRVGPSPEIHWDEFGSSRFLAPLPPRSEINIMGLKLCYFANYVAGQAGHGERAIEMESFFEIGSGVRQRLQSGAFIPSAIGLFPTREARQLIDKAQALEPRYGDLMRELLRLSFFEAQGWSATIPLPDAVWNDSFLYELRNYVAEELMASEERATAVLEDKALIRVVRGENKVADVRWHAGKTRREVYDAWLQKMSRGDEALLESRRSFLGEGILRAIGWTAPRNGVPAEQRLQWTLRDWIARHHYGALPAQGLPFPTDVILRFAMATSPKRPAHKFSAGLLEMVGGTQPAPVAP